MLSSLLLSAKPHCKHGKLFQRVKQVGPLGAAMEICFKFINE